MKVLWMVASCVGALVIAACASTQTDRVGMAPSAQRDRTTESDETPDTRRARVRLELATAYYARGQLPIALDEVKLALSADPKLVPALNLRGLIYAGLADHSLAEESFKRALQMDSRDADTLQNYGWYLCQRRRFNEADAYFDQVLAIPIYNHVQRTLVAKGVCQSRNGLLDLAEQTLMKAYELGPSNLLASLSLAEVLYQRGQYERARFYVRRVNLDPDLLTPQSLWIGARIENKLNNSSGVAILGQQLRDRFPETAEARAFEKGRFDD